MASSKPDIAFIGLGAMGFGMATNLVKQGYKVTGFDVWGPTLERFQAEGGLTATTPAEAVKGKDYCVCMVATAQQAQAVLLEGESAAVPALPQGAAVLLCSTVPCSYVQDLERQLAAAGRGDLQLVDAPARFLLQEMSDPAKLYIVAGGIGAGSNMKMVHQVLAANQILATSEALGFAAHLGLDLKKAADTVVGSQGKSWMFEHRSPRALHPEFQPIASATTIILKDTGIITAEARRAGFPTPMTSAAEQVYFAGVGRGYGPDDDSSLVRLYWEGKGKVGPVAGTAQTEEEKLALVVGLLKGIHLCSAGECIAFAARLGLDLDQVFELCINAAGGSAMLEAVGPEMMSLVKTTGAAAGAPAGDSLDKVVGELQDAVDEAQRLKAPIFLGSQALNLTRLAMAHRPKTAAAATAGMVVKVWGS
ncbi:hypothetical protein PG991_014830 [Apiospora marii]|uniref:3-hydroxyisobutyrate dehydrogenase n=1 Tax=Apiospora marii TaxID=335849 RepID=A0ABR1R5I4_9PEZI